MSKESLVKSSNVIKNFLEMKKQAPDAQKILESGYCPPSFSNVSNILPLQNGYPYLSIKPPEAPAYSKKSLLFISRILG